MILLIPVPDFDRKRHLIGDEFYKPLPSSPSGGSGEATVAAVTPQQLPQQLPIGSFLVDVSDSAGAIATSAAAAVTGVPTLIPADSVQSPEVGGGGTTIVFANQEQLIGVDGERTIVYATDPGGVNSVVTAVTLADVIKKEHSPCEIVSSASGGTLCNANGKHS